MQLSTGLSCRFRFRVSPLAGKMPTPLIRFTHDHHAIAGMADIEFIV